MVRLFDVVLEIELPVFKAKLKKKKKNNIGRIYFNNLI